MKNGCYNVIIGTIAPVFVKCDAMANCDDYLSFHPIHSFIQLKVTMKNLERAKRKTVWWLLPSSLLYIVFFSGFQSCFALLCFRIPSSFSVALVSKSRGPRSKRSYLRRKVAFFHVRMSINNNNSPNKLRIQDTIILYYKATERARVRAAK
jgi:hypothetical protein